MHETVLNFSKTGRPYWLDMKIVPLRNSAGEVIYFAAIERDITDVKRREQSPTDLAVLLAGTGLALAARLLEQFRADRALYNAKHAGCNQVVIAA